MDAAPEKADFVLLWLFVAPTLLVPCFNGDIPPPPPTPPALNPPNGRPVDAVVDFLLFDPPVPNMFAPKLLALPVAEVELTDVVPAAGDELLLPPKLNPPDLLSVLLGGANGFIFEEILVLKPAANGRDGAPPSFFDVDVVFDEPNNPPPPALLLLALDDPAAAEGAPEDDDGSDDAKDEPNISRMNNKSVNKVQ